MKKTRPQNKNALKDLKRKKTKKAKATPLNSQILPETHRSPGAPDIPRGDQEKGTPAESGLPSKALEQTDQEKEDSGQQDRMAGL